MVPGTSRENCVNFSSFRERLIALMRISSRSAGSRRNLQAPDQRHRGMGAGIPGSPAGPMLRQPSLEILGDPSVERAVATAEDVDVRHLGIIGEVGGVQRLDPERRHYAGA